MKAKCRVLWLGRRTYADAWELQKKLAERRLAGDLPDTLLLLEHPPTITLGRGVKGDHIVASPDTLAHAGISVIATDRGGDVTYHGPGQLVGYPILNLQQPPHQPDLRLYLRQLEETLIRTLASFDVVAGRLPPYTGVWTGLDTPHPEKIAAIGVKASRWITQHGFALKTSIRTCHTSISLSRVASGSTELPRCRVVLARNVTIPETTRTVAATFAEVFGYEGGSEIDFE